MQVNQYQDTGHVSNWYKFKKHMRDHKYRYLWWLCNVVIVVLTAAYMYMAYQLCVPKGV